MTLTVLNSTAQVFSRMNLNLDLSEVFLMIRLGLWVFWEEDDRGKEAFHHIMSRVHAMDMSYHCCY